jgi:hypothetical protein
MQEAPAEATTQLLSVMRLMLTERMSTGWKPQKGIAMFMHWEICSRRALLEVATIQTMPSTSGRTPLRLLFLAEVIIIITTSVSYD